MTPRPWQLTRSSFSEYSSALRQTSQTTRFAKKTRQHDVDNLMKMVELDGIKFKMSIIL